MLFQFLTDWFVEKDIHHRQQQQTNFDSSQFQNRPTNQHGTFHFSVPQSELQMGDSEKMMALKKAYAEIILNTAKESAARVMVAERKAVRYQRELADVKDDALRMMLRLKQMMDFKINEADVAASRQQSKIDELEAQLHEAEDIVKDLREELTIVRDELDCIRKSRPQQSSEQQDNQVVTQGQEAQREEIAPSISGFEHSQILKVQTKHMAEFEMGNLFERRINGSIPDGQCETLKVSNLDIASNVSPTKELGSLVNGSSQGIHELTSENLSNEDCLHERSHFVKDDSTVRDDCENSGKYVTQASSSKVYVLERKSHNRTKQDKKSKKPFYLEVNTKACKHAFKKSKMSSSLRKSQSLAKNILKSLQKTYLTTSKVYPCAVVSSAVKETDGLKHSGLLFKAVKLCSDVGLNGPIQVCSQSTPESDKSKIVKVSTGEENGSADSSVTCADSEIACVPSCAIREERDELDADDALQPKTDRSIKFTFQRKRKKECMGTADENDTVEVKKSSDSETLVKTTNAVSNCNGLFNGSSHPIKSKENTLKELKRSLKRMNVDKQDFKTSMKHVDGELPTDMDPKVIGIVPKATRDSRRLRQVARQLLSMSEKKWWD